MLSEEELKEIEKVYHNPSDGDHPRNVKGDIDVLIKALKKQNKALRKVEAKARAFHKNNNDYDCILDIPFIVRAAILPKTKDKS